MIVEGYHWLIPNLKIFYKGTTTNNNNDNKILSND